MQRISHYGGPGGECGGSLTEAEYDRDGTGLTARGPKKLPVVALRRQNLASSEVSPERGPKATAAGMGGLLQHAL